MKLFTTFLIASLAALAVYSARRRIRFALKTGAIVYLVVLFGRLLLSAGSLGDRWEDVALPVLVMLVAWVVVWWISTTYVQRRAKRPVRSASGAGRPGR